MLKDVTCRHPPEKELRFYSLEGCTTTISIMEVQNANDNVFVVFLSKDLKATVHLQQAHIGLAINIKKNQVIHQPPPNCSAPFLLTTISIDNTMKKKVDHFPCVGSLKSSEAFSTLKETAFKNSNVLPRTTILVYKAVVLSTLLFARKHLKHIISNVWKIPLEWVGRIGVLTKAEG